MKVISLSFPERNIMYNGKKERLEKYGIISSLEEKGYWRVPHLKTFHYGNARGHHALWQIAEDLKRLGYVIEVDMKKGEIMLAY